MTFGRKNDILVQKSEWFDLQPSFSTSTSIYLKFSDFTLFMKYIHVMWLIHRIWFPHFAPNDMVAAAPIFHTNIAVLSGLSIVCLLDIN